LLGIERFEGRNKVGLGEIEARALAQIEQGTLLLKGAKRNLPFILNSGKLAARYERISLESL
jgi:hypothetical protein